MTSTIRPSNSNLEIKPFFAFIHINSCPLLTVAITNFYPSFMTLLLFYNALDKWHTSWSYHLSCGCILFFMSHVLSSTMHAKLMQLPSYSSTNQNHSNDNLQQFLIGVFTDQRFQFFEHFPRQSILYGIQQTIYNNNFLSLHLRITT